MGSNDTTGAVYLGSQTLTHPSLDAVTISGAPILWHVSIALII